MSNWWESSPVAEEKTDATPAANWWDEHPTEGDQGAPKKQNTSLIGDIGTGLKRGALQIPGIATGLGDIVSAPLAVASGVRKPISKAADWLGKKTGLQFGKWADEATAEYSPEMQQAIAHVDEAQGFFPALKAAVEKPRSIANLVAESLPSTLVGGVAARGAMGAVMGAERLAATRLAAAAGDKAAKASLLKAGSIAGGIGEGAVTAGQQMEQTDASVDPLRAAGSAIGSGIGTGIIGAAGGRLATRLGLPDIDTAYAAGTLGDGVKAGATTAAKIGNTAKRMAIGGVQEGVFEEMPQSAQEQVWQNVANGKPWDEGIGEAMAQGLIAGTAMGAGVNALPRGTAAEPQPKPEAEPIAGYLNAPTQTGTPSDQVLQSEVERANAVAAAQANADALYSERDAFEKTRVINNPNIAVVRNQGGSEVVIDARSGPLSSAAVSAVKTGATLRERDFVPPPSGNFGQMNEFADLLNSERQDVEGQRQKIATTQQLRRDSAMETTDARVEAQRLKETAQKRDALLANVLDNLPEGQNPKRAFDRALRSLGFTNLEFRPEETARINHWQGISQNAESDTIPAAPNELDAAAMGIRERRVETPEEIRQRAIAENRNKLERTRQKIAAQRKGQSNGGIPASPINAEVASPILEVGRNQLPGSGSILASAPIGDTGSVLSRAEVAASGVRSTVAAGSPGANGLDNLTQGISNGVKTDETFPQETQRAKEPAAPVAPEVKGYKLGQAKMISGRMKNQGLPSEIYPHPTQEGMYAIRPQGNAEAGPSPKPIDRPSPTPQSNDASLPSSVAQRLQEAHKALGYDVTRKQVQAMRDRVANEIESGTINNGGVVVRLKPSAISERKQRLSRLDADLALFDLNGSGPSAKAKPEQPAVEVRANGKNPIMRRDDLVGAIMRATGGRGIHSNMATTLVGDTANNATRLRGLFTNQGQQDMDDLAMLLREQEGFDVRDASHLEDLVREAASGNVAVSMERQERDKADAQEKQYRDTIRQKAKKFGIKTVAVKFSDVEKSVLARMEERHNQAVAELDERSQRRFNAALEDAMSAVPEAVVDETMAEVTRRGLSARDFWNETTRILRGMIYDAKQEAANGTETAAEEVGDGRGNRTTGRGTVTDQRDQAPAGQADERSAEPAEEQRPGLALEGQTPAEVRAQEAQRQAEEARTNRPEPDTSPRVKADQVDLFNTQSALFNNNRETPAEQKKQKSIPELQAELKKADPFSRISGDLNGKLIERVTEDAQQAIDSGIAPTYGTGQGTFVVIHPSAQNEGMIQVTRYSERGVFGDSQYNTLESAIRDNVLWTKARMSQSEADAALKQSLEAEAEYQRKREEFERPKTLQERISANKQKKQAENAERAKKFADLVAKRRAERSAVFVDKFSGNPISLSKEQISAIQKFSTAAESSGGELVTFNLSGTTYLAAKPKGGTSWRVGALSSNGAVSKQSDANDALMGFQYDDQREPFVTTQEYDSTAREIAARKEEAKRIAEKESAPRWYEYQGTNSAMPRSLIKMNGEWYRIGDENRLVVFGNRKADKAARMGIDLDGGRDFKSGNTVNVVDFVLQYTPTPGAPKNPEKLDASAEHVKETAENNTGTQEQGKQKLEDFGQKLGGAKKDRASMREMLREHSDDEIASLPLSKIWPTEEIDKIEDTFAAAVAYAARSEIPAKPRTAYKVKRWVETVKAARKMVADFFGRFDLSREKFLEKTGDYSALRTQFIPKVLLLEQIDRNQWKRVGSVSERPDSYRYDKDGKQVKTPHVAVEIDGKSQWIAGESVADVMEQVNALLDGEAQAKKMQFEVRGRGESFSINKKGDSEYRKLKTFTTSKEALDFVKSGYAELVAEWEAVKDRDNVKEADVRGEENRPRTGQDWRKGKDVTPEQFTNELGFRGIEFGNWVSQGKNAKERQGMLNQAYDALMDLANITGIPPKALSLNGSLGLGFGSRGSGAASAHFEPGTLVINLTKTRGAGTLAHEFFHALDNYFSRLRGGEVAFTGDNAAYRQNNYVTYKPEPLFVHKTQRSTPITKARLEQMHEQNPSSGYFAPFNWQEDPNHPQGVRPVVEKAFADLVKALDESPMAVRAKANDKGADGYWGRIIERGARSFENYVISKMMQDGYNNDYLANVRNAADFPRSQSRYPYLFPEEVAPISEAFDTLFQTIETKETEQGIALFNQANNGRITPADKAIYGMAAEGKSATEILKFIADTSRNPFYRQLSKLLQKTNLATSIEVGESKGWKFNAGDGKYAAAYNPKTDTAALFRPASSERNTLHELMHAATLKALQKKGLAATQMRALFQHVEKSGKLKGMYGMANVDEFIAEAFSNPKFQAMLKQVSAAPVGGKPSSAWDWFIRVVRGILGLKQGHDNALSQALEIGVELMRENMGLKANAKDGSIQPMPDNSTASGRGNNAPAPEADIGEAKHVKAARQMLEAIGDETYDYGLRVLPDDFANEIKPGDSLPSSFVWENGDITKNELDGVSTAGVRRADIESVIAAMTNLGVTGKNGPNGYYFGNRVVLVRGERNGTGQDVGEVIIRKPEVIGEWKKPKNGLAEVLPNEPTASAGSDADIRYNIIGDSGRAYDARHRAFFKNVGRDVDRQNVIEKTLDYLKSDFWKKMAVGIVDQFRGLRDLNDGGQAYLLARLSKGTAGAFDTLLHHGKLSLKDGVYDGDTSGGFVERLGVPLNGELDDFLWWVAANRAEKLTADGKENLFSPQDIQAGKSLAAGLTTFDYTIQTGQSKGTTTRNRQVIYQDALRVFNGFQKNVLDMAEQSGLIDGASRQHWESDFYVPFYRVSEEDGEFVGAKMGNALVRQQAFKKLKGGTDKLNSDLLTNTLMNLSHLIEASAKNRAATAALTAAEKIGAARKAIHGEKHTVWHMDKGQKVEYKVEDPFVMTAITSLEYAGMRNGVMDAMTKFKHWLTIGVTASPAFKVRNLIRDSIQAIGTSDLSYNPIKNVTEGFKQTKRDSQAYVSALASGGLIRFGTMLEGSESNRVRQLIKSGVKDSSILNNEAKWRQFYDKYIEPAVSAYNELGNRSEEINRAALYNQLIKQGKSHAEAALLARDLMDFSMQGSFNTIRFLSQVTPFFNARLQGMYKLGRSAKDNPRKLAVVTGAVALASIALMAGYEDDEDWKRREDWDRDGFFWFKFGGIEYRIPKPFEVGAVASLSERSVEYLMNDEMTGERFRKVVGALAMNNLSMNPVPQMVKPIIDLYANKDSFTGRPIESMSMERLEKTMRFNSNTSMPARALSNATLGALSPVQYDHLARAYFGWLGAFSVGGADMAYRAVSDEPTQPALDYFKFFSQGILKEEGTGSSRYLSNLYDQASELETVYSTYRQLLKDGKGEEASEYAEDNTDELRRYKSVEAIKKVQTRMNQNIRVIERDPEMDSDEKKIRIDRIQKMKEQFAKRISPGA